MMTVWFFNKMAAQIEFFFFVKSISRKKRENFFKDPERERSFPQKTHTNSLLSIIIYTYCCCYNFGFLCVIYYIRI